MKRYLVRHILLAKLTALALLTLYLMQLRVGVQATGTEVFFRRMIVFIASVRLKV